MIIATIIFAICGLILYSMYSNADPDTKQFARTMFVASLVTTLLTVMFTIAIIGIIELVGGAQC